MSKTLAEYIWIDGGKPTAMLRSKTKVLEGPIRKLDQIPEWGFDGSSTGQAVTGMSDCRLKPVFYTNDPIRKGDHILVLCEVFNSDNSVHESNTRAVLRRVEEQYRSHEAWFGIEQEYTFMSESMPLGFPKNGFPEPQGKYYCGVGADRAFGREIVEEHMQACLDANLAFVGINAEVMPGQWEFQIGAVPALDVSDHLWMARFLLTLIAEEFGVQVSFSPKPVKGDWNGTGAHTNFSTKLMRETGGMHVIEQACKKLEQKHAEHISVYGHGNEERLTGRHETCSITQFRYGVSDRGASIRIPLATSIAGSGYFEDRRPAANCDPYQVCARLLETVCGE